MSLVNIDSLVDNFDALSTDGDLHSTSTATTTTTTTKKKRGRPVGSKNKVSFNDNIASLYQEQTQAEESPLKSRFEEGIQNLIDEGVFSPPPPPPPPPSTPQSGRKSQGASQKGSHQQETKQRKPDDIEQQRIKYIKKVNRYLDDPVLSKFLQGRQKLPLNTDFNYALSYYKEIKSVLNSYNLLPVVQYGFIKANKLVELFMPNMDGFSKCVEQNIDDFSPELNEIAVELGDYFGEGNVYFRLGLKWIQCIQAYKQISYAPSKLNDEFTENS